MKAFYAGSFDPFTIGHQSIADRALKMFDELIIGIGYNGNKQNEQTIEERISQIKKIYYLNPAVFVFAYSGLTAEVAKENGASILVRGVRNGIDFEKEKELADINLKIFDIPTIMIPSDPELSFISSSMVRELTHFGYDASRYIAKPLTINKD